MLTLLLTLGLLAQDATTPVAVQPATTQSANTHLELFDVRDLVTDSPRISTDVNERVRSQARLERLGELLRDKLPIPARNGLVSLTTRQPGTLMVEGSDAVLAFAAAFLETQRRERSPVMLSMQLVEVPHMLLAELGVDGSSKLFETESDYQALVAKLNAAPDVELINTPSITTMAREPASLSVSSQVSYIADYQLVLVEPGHQEILDPIIEVAEEGTWIEFMAVPVPGGTVDFEIDVTVSELERPIATEMVRFGAGSDRLVELSRPKISKVNISSLISMRPGSAALIASASPSKDRDLIVLIHFERAPVVHSERVEALFRSMAEGAWRHRWFPPLEWSDIPALLSHASDRGSMKAFPTSPLGDVRPPAVLSGAIALWLIEGLREEGHWPSLAPVLIELGGELDVRLATQAQLLDRAQTAYRQWFEALDAGANEADSASPLAAIGLRWY